MNLFDNRDLGNISFQAPMSGADDDVKQDFQSKKESSDDELFGDLAKGYGSFSKEINPEVRAGAMADVAGVKSRLQRYGIETPDEDGVSQRFKSTFHDIVAPKQTPERRMRQYAQSDAALDAVLDDNFSKDMKQRLDKNRQASQNEINSDYIRNTSVVGANPEMTFNISLKAHDPLKDVEKTIVETDYEKLAEHLAPIVKHGGYDMQEYVNERAVPAMYEKLLDEIIEEEVPKSSAEYILRSSIGNSLTGKAALLGKNLLTGNIADTQLQSEALGRYNPGFFEDVLSGVGSLLVDGPVFSSMGSLGMHAMGKVTGLLTKRLSTRILASKLGEGMTTATATQLAQRLITRKLAHKILVSSGTQGITLGGYDAMNSVVDDLLAQNDVSMGKAAGSFGKGLLTGAVLGAVGTPLRESAKGLTGAKKMLASSGVLSAESAIFTAGTEIEKLKHDIDIAPIDLMEDFAKSTATLILMKMAHWRPKGADIKLDAKGKLKEGFALSNSEKAELRELNVNPEQLMAAIEAELKLPSFGGERARFIKEAYSKLMTDERLSASAKSKLLFLVDNRITTTPPLAFDYDVKQRDDNKWNVITYNPAGKVVSDELFDHAGNARSYMMVNRAMIRRNRIVLFETELTGGFRSENFLRQAGLYAREKNRNIDDIAVAIYKKCTGEELTPAEKVIVDEILERASYEEAGMVQMLYDVRRKIEKRHGLDEGSMMLAINKHFYNLTEKQNNALDEYEKVVRDEVDRLKKGTDRRRAVRLLKEGLTSEYFGMSNEEVKEREIEDYHNWVAERDADRVGLRQESYTPGPPRLMYIPPEDNSGYVWSFGEAKNTKEDIAAYSKRADEMGERLGVKLNYIFDEREIVRPDPEDYRAVVEYNNQIVASGWLNKEKVFINLPNAKNMQDLEKTVLHEVVGHKGLLNVFGEHLYDFMEDVFRKASPEVLRGINKIKHKYKSVDNYTLIEEYLAYLAESVSLEPAERSLYVKVKDYIKSLLIRMNLYTGSNRQISEAELIRIMQRHCEYMQRGVAPQEYIKEVFGDFKSAHFNENTYHNRAEFNKGIKSAIEKGKLLSSTPKPFRKTKELMYYDLMSPEQQKAIREKYGVVDDEAQNQGGENVHRMAESSSENPWDKKTTFSERSGVIPGNSSSEGLLHGSSGHLSRYSLATQEDVAKLTKNSEIIKKTAIKKINQGGFSTLKTVEDAVRKIGESLKLVKSKSSQSFYGDFYEGDIVTNDGNSLHLRISTHPATGDRMGNYSADDKISIVVYKNGEHISRDKHNGYSEYVYYPNEVPLNDAANAILEGVVNLIKNGEYVDKTGKALRIDYPYYQDGKLYYRLPDGVDKKTTSSERGGAIPGNPSSEGLLRVSNEHLSRYALTSQEDVAKLQHGMADSKENVLKHVETAGGYMPDLGTGSNIRYRLPDEEQRAHMWNERRDPESEAAGRVTRNGSVEQVPVLEDPFYRSLRANSPTYSYVYEHLRKLPLEEWGSHDHELWNTLVGMAEGGAVKFVLKDIVTDRKFLADYPELAMVPVSVEKDLPMPVMYDKARNRILLDRRVYLYPQSKFYIDGALRSVARDFEERRSSAERQVNEFNSGFRKRYDDAVAFAGKIAKMRELIPGFDESNGIAEAYMNEFGFMPDEFMRRFPTMDDYLLYRVTRGMNGLMDESLTPEQRMEKEKMLEKKITRHRKFFWGPIEIIMDAAGNGSNEGPLRVATAKDRENSGLPRSGLDRSESEALFMKYFPGVFRYFNIPDPTIRRDPTGWEEYKRIRNARKKAEKEKLMREEERRRAEEEERERERRRLEMN